MHYTWTLLQSVRCNYQQLVIGLKWVLVSSSVFTVLHEHQLFGTDFVSHKYMEEFFLCSSCQSQTVSAQ